jgi:hypothetical protein
VILVINNFSIIHFALGNKILKGDYDRKVLSVVGITLNKYVTVAFRNYILNWRIILCTCYK